MPASVSRWRCSGFFREVGGAFTTVCHVGQRPCSQIMPPISKDQFTLARQRFVVGPKQFNSVANRYSRRMKRANRVQLMRTQRRMDCIALVAEDAISESLSNIKRGTGRARQDIDVIRASSRSNQAPGGVPRRVYGRCSDFHGAVRATALCGVRRSTHQPHPGNLMLQYFLRKRSSPQGRDSALVLGCWLSEAA